MYGRCHYFVTLHGQFDFLVVVIQTYSKQTNRQTRQKEMNPSSLSNISTHTVQIDLNYCLVFINVCHIACHRELHATNIVGRIASIECVVFGLTIAGNRKCLILLDESDECVEYLRSVRKI